MTSLLSSQAPDSDVACVILFVTLSGTQLGSTSSRSGIAIYGRSKLMFLMWSMELQHRLREAGVKDVDVLATHPGE